MRPGTLRYKGDAPTVGLIGYSFEYHDEYGQRYFADPSPTASSIPNELNGGYVFPAHFQYAKTGGRCARVKSQ